MFSKTFVQRFLRKTFVFSFQLPVEIAQRTYVFSVVKLTVDVNSAIDVPGVCRVREISRLVR